MVSFYRSVCCLHVRFTKPPPQPRQSPPLPSYSGRSPPPLLGTDFLDPDGIRLGAFEVRLIRVCLVCLKQWSNLVFKDLSLRCPFCSLCCYTAYKSMDSRGGLLFIFLHDEVVLESSDCLNCVELFIKWQNKCMKKNIATRAIFFKEIEK